MLLLFDFLIIYTRLGSLRAVFKSGPGRIHVAVSAELTYRFRCFVSSGDGLVNNSLMEPLS